jgi:hypothetical protein
MLPGVLQRQDGAFTVIARPAMSNDLSIHATASANTGNDGVAPVRSTATAVSADQPAPESAASPNPTMELNAALGLVVIEFRNAAGAIVSSIPNQQQLAAYQLWQDGGIGTPPPNSGASTGSGAAVPIQQASGDYSRSTESHGQNA